ncbi:MAG: hypothetical protein MUC50_05980 [Myxococcota bacterium]|nr:hypothetical protein [Myxococcota bacterium]
MRTTDEEMMRREHADVVQLSVEGARNAVNTIREQQTGGGMYLVCPFPALEVNVPVMLGRAGEKRRGAIHRIGVEDDPETGLPRLRLSIRTEEERATVVAAASPVLVESSNVEPTGEIALRRCRKERLEAVVETLDVLSIEEEESAARVGAIEPPWIDAKSFPMPDELKARGRTRRRYHIASALVWTAILSMVAGGSVALERAGIVDVDELRQIISGFSMDAPRVQSKSQVPAAQALSSLQLAEMEIAKVEANPAPPAQASVETLPLAPGELGEGGVEEVNVQLASSEGSEQLQVGVGEPVVAPSAPVEPQEPTAAEKAPAPELAIVLPTRWPAEYATAYRMREPNGVVVDVPGGLVKREGWLEIAEQYPMVRSIKAVQRETGARFIVYTKGDEMPRFVTDPQKSGVVLRLIWSDSDDAQQQLATL